MTEYDILDAIGDIDSAYLEEAKRKPIPAKMKWIGVGSAACLFLLLTFPVVYRQLMMTNEACDYAPQAYEICSVYYVKEHVLCVESVGVVGGDVEMFDVWKEKNNIDSEAELKHIAFSDGDSEYEESSHCETVSVTVSAILESYFENEDGGLLLEALKNTIASYRKITIGTLTLIYR